MAQEEEGPTRFSEAEQDELDNDPDADEGDEDLAHQDVPATSSPPGQLHFCIACK